MASSTQISPVQKANDTRSSGATAPVGATPPASAARDPKAHLRGIPYDAQVAALTPGAAPPVQMAPKAGAQPAPAGAGGGAGGPAASAPAAPMYQSWVTKKTAATNVYAHETGFLGNFPTEAAAVAEAAPTAKHAWQSGGGFQCWMPQPAGVAKMSLYGGGIVGHYAQRESAQAGSADGGVWGGPPKPAAAPGDKTDAAKSGDGKGEAGKADEKGETKKANENTFELPSFELWKGTAGPLAGEIKFGGDVAVSVEGGATGPAGLHALGPDEEKGGAPGSKVTVGAGGTSKGVGIGVEVEKELKDQSIYGFEVSPSVKGGAKLGKNGLEIGVGYSLKHKLGKGADLNFSPTFNIISWAPGEEPKLGEFKVAVGATLPLCHYTTKKGVTVGLILKPALTGSVWISPKEAAKMILEVMAETSATAIAAAAAPITGVLAAAAGLLYAWGKAGHELDDFELEAAKAAVYGHCYTNVLLGKKADAGLGGLQVSKNVAAAFAAHKGLAAQQAMTDAPASLKAMATERGLPEEAMRKLMPSGDKIYGNAWNAKWPSIKDAWLKRVGDDKVLAMTIDAFGSGPYSRYDH